MQNRGHRTKKILVAFLVEFIAMRPEISGYQSQMFRFLISLRDRKRLKILVICFEKPKIHRAVLYSSVKRARRFRRNLKGNVGCRQ